jgi:hypothetical protein
MCYQIVSNQAVMLIEEVAYIFSCVVHAFIYAEPKEILQNQSSFWLNQFDFGCPV